MKKRTILAIGLLAMSSPGFGVPEVPKPKPLRERSAPVSEETRQRIYRSLAEIPADELFAMPTPSLPPDPGVSVEIHVTGRSVKLAEEFRGTYTVDDNGTISFPFVGPLQVQGSTWQDVAIRLRDSIQHLGIGLDDAEVEIVTANQGTIVSTGGPARYRILPRMPFKRIDAPGPGYRQQATDAIIWIRSVQ